MKANEGTLGLTGAVPRYDCAASTAAGERVSSIAEWALADGRDAGECRAPREGTLARAREGPLTDAGPSRWLQGS